MPTDNDINYRQFTRTQLSEALANIDAEQFPQNYQNLLAEIAVRKPDGGAETLSQRSVRVTRLQSSRGNVTLSVGTKLIYGASGAFYLCMPLFIIFGLHKPIVEPAWALAAIAMIWVVAAFYLYGFCVTYKFESGAITCVLFGRYVMWKDRLETLENIETNFIKGLPTIYFVWPDHRRRLWLRVSDLDSANVIA
jgi:hypothetical protein